MRNNVNDAMSIVGEQVFILRMFSSVNPPTGNKRCEFCYDEVYSNTASSTFEDQACPHCFGTTYENGIKEIYYTKAILGKALNSDNMEQNKGQSTFTSHRAKTTWPAKLHKNDFLIRVFSYTHSKNVDNIDVVTPSDILVYKLVSSSDNTVIKDGFYNTGLDNNRIGSAFTVVLQSDKHPLYKHTLPPIFTQTIREKQPFVYFPDYIPIQANKDDIIIK